MAYGVLLALGIEPHKMTLRIKKPQPGLMGASPFSRCECFVKGWVEKEGDPKSKPEDKFVPLREFLVRKIHKNPGLIGKDSIHKLGTATLIMLVSYDFLESMGKIKTKEANELYEDFNKKMKFEEGTFSKKEIWATPKKRMQTLIKEKVDLLRTRETNDITQFIFQTLLTSSRSAGRLVSLLKRMSEWPKDMLPKNYNLYVERILVLLKDKKELSLTQVSIVLDALKSLKGGIGNYGIELMQKHIQSFGEKFKKISTALNDNKMLNAQDLKEYENNLEELKKQKLDISRAFNLSDLDMPLTRKDKLKTFEKGNLQAHLDKSWKNKGIKLIQKIIRIITGAQSEYEMKKRTRQQLTEKFSWLQERVKEATQTFQKKMKEAIPEVVDSVKHYGIVGKSFSFSSFDLTMAVPTEAKLKVLPKPASKKQKPMLFEPSRVKGANIRSRIETLYEKPRATTETPQKKSGRRDLLLLKDKKESPSVKSLRIQFEKPKENEPAPKRKAPYPKKTK